MDIQTYIETERIRPSDFAAAVGVSPNLVYQWVKRIRPVAAHHCPSIERVTDGKVSRQELRPDDWTKYWPDLAPPKRKRVRKLLTVPE